VELTGEEDGAACGMQHVGGRSCHLQRRCGMVGEKGHHAMKMVPPFIVVAWHGGLGEGH